MFLLNFNTKTLIFIAFLIRATAIFAVIDIAVALLLDQTKGLLVLFELLLFIFVVYLPA